MNNHRGFGRIRLRSQLYLNRGDTPAQATRWIDQMADAGLRLIRLFVGWDLVVGRKGVWTWEVFEAVFAAADRSLPSNPDRFPASPGPEPRALVTGPSASSSCFGVLPCCV